MTISRMQRQKTDQTMVNIFLDGKFSFSLPDTAVYEYRLKSGQDIAEDLYRELLLLSQNNKAKRKAINLLSYRSHSKKELTQKLVKKGIDQAAAENAVCELENKGYVDNLAFASMYASHLVSKYYANSKISYELSLKGIDKETANEVISELEEEEARIRLFAAKKNPKNKSDLQKLYAALARRGFSYETVKSALYSFSLIDDEPFSI